MKKTLFTVIYEGTDITNDISEDVISITYVDNEDGKVDDVTISLKDESGKWIGPWMPKKGDLLSVMIKPFNAIALNCGKFEVDEISASGPPSTIEIKAVSVPIKSGIRRLLKTKAWEKTTLKTIATEMAAASKLEFLYLVDEDPYYGRQDQTEQSDLAFLHRMAQDEGFSLKVTDSQLVIFDQAMFESKDPITTFYHKQPPLTGWGFSTQSHDLYKSCTCKYRIPKKKKTIAYTYTDPDIEDGSNLKIRKLVANGDEAKRKAKAMLRMKNRYQYTGSLTMPGNTDMVAGVTFMYAGSGGFDGKYIVQQSTHTIAGGYTTTVEIRRVIEGY